MSATRNDPVAGTGVAERPTRSKIGLRLRALRALRWNYRWRGVFVWLKGRQRCRNCNATGYVLGPSKRHQQNPLVTIACSICRSTTKVRGYHRTLSEPEKVLAEQTALAEGVMG